MRDLPSVITADSRLHRRNFLQGLVLGLPLAASWPRRLLAGSFADDLIMRTQEPENREMPFASLDSFLTPPEKFYIRNHFGVPKLEVESWKLKVEGAVQQPLELTYADLKGQPLSKAVALLECAGNGRSFLTPKTKGVQWECGAVGNTEWVGVPLGSILEKAGLRDSAVEVILEGADEGEIKDEPKPPGKIHFARGLPLDKARKPDVLLALQMGGKDLTPAHGFPVRAVVPGWYGMASVKWLTRIIVSDRPFRGHFQTIDYSYFAPQYGLPTVTPLSEIQVKAQIARPARQEVLPAGKPYRIHGAAWAGETSAAKVEVSLDGGQQWSEAHFSAKPALHTWRLWEFEWASPATGKHVLMARATDTEGRTQPMQRDPNRRNYMISHILPVEVEVR